MSLQSAAQLADTATVSTREEELTEALKGLFAAFNEGDFAGATSLAHPDVEFVRAWDPAPLSGAEAVRAWMAPDAFEDQHSEMEEIIFAGEKVMVRQMFTARGAGSGIEASLGSWLVITFTEDGLMLRVELFLEHDEAAARKAAGLPNH